MTSWLRYLTHISSSVSPKWNSLSLPPNLLPPHPSWWQRWPSEGSLSEILAARLAPLISLYITPHLPASPASSTCQICQNLTTSHHLCCYSCSQTHIMPSTNYYKNLLAALPAFLLIVSSQSSSLSDLRWCQLMLFLCLKPLPMAPHVKVKVKGLLTTYRAALSLSLPCLLLHFSSLCFRYIYPYLLHARHTHWGYLR